MLLAKVSSLLRLSTNWDTRKKVSFRATRDICETFGCCFGEDLECYILFLVQRFGNHKYILQLESRFKCPFLRQNLLIVT